MKHPQPWMPEECLGQERVSRPLEPILADWAYTWFAQSSWNIAGTWASETWPLECWTNLREGARVAVRGNANAILRLAFAMLGERERPNLTARDLRLLRRLAVDTLEDLIARLEANLPGHHAPEGAEQERWSLALDMDGDAIIRVSIDRSDLSLLARKSFAPICSGGALDPAVAAVAGLSVPVGAQIGCASLAIDQIGALEPGDILLLDRPVDEPVALVVAGLPSPVRCSITDVNGALGLIVCETEEN